MEPTELAAIGIVAIAAIECVALWRRVNGKVMSTVVAAVAGIVGFAFGVGVG